MQPRSHVGRLLACFILAGCLYGWITGPVHRARAIGDVACKQQSSPARINVSVSKYPHVWRHVLDARAGRNTASNGKTVVNNGLRWPTILTKNDQGEAERRAAAFAAAGVPTKHGYDRDEYPPAEGRSSSLADIRYVPSHENRSQGASMGGQLRVWCNGQEYRLVKAP